MIVCINIVVWAPGINPLPCATCCFGNHQLKCSGLLPSIVTFGEKLKFGCGEEAAELGGTLAGSRALPAENKRPFLLPKMSTTFQTFSLSMCHKVSLWPLQCLNKEQLITGCSAQSVGRVPGKCPRLTPKQSVTVACPLASSADTSQGDRELDIV